MNEVSNQIANAGGNSLLSFFYSSDLLCKLILLLLLSFSVFSWAVIFFKLFNFSKLEDKIKKFDRLFWSGQALDDLYKQVKHSSDNLLSEIFVSAMGECKKHVVSQSSDLLKIGYRERVFQSMYYARDNNIDSLEKFIPFLATIGSTAPFVGLFGTVLGIMHSFQSIAASKNTSLAVVAPGIAEALFVTAIGLFVAIPALIAYNYLTLRIDNIYNKSELFINEFGRLLSRAIDDNKI